MKKYLFVISLFTSVLFSGLANAQSYYGAKIDPDGAMAMGDLVKQMQGKEEMAARWKAKFAQFVRLKVVG